MNNLNESISEKPSVETQRENLLNLNPDMMCWVYSLEGEDDENISLSLVKNALCLYPHQLENIQGLDENPDVNLINITDLRKGNISVLHGNGVEIKNPIIVSGGVIEFFAADKWDGTTRDHILLTLRDYGSTCPLHYTSVAGGSIWENLFEDLEREQAEESPFLLKDSEGNYALWLRKLDSIFLRNLQGSIKYLKQKITNYQKNPEKSDEMNQAEKFLKTSFPKIKNLNELVKILDEIVENQNFVQYSAETLEDYPWANMKNVSLGDSRGRFYVFHDEANNVIEYNKLERVLGIPENYTLAGRGSSRLFLESINQRPSSIARNNWTKKLVPFVQNFVNKTLSKI